MEPGPEPLWLVYLQDGRKRIEEKRGVGGREGVFSWNINFD
jgi:hypothetical protein